MAHDPKNKSSGDRNKQSNDSVNKKPSNNDWFKNFMSSTEQYDDIMNIPEINPTCLLRDEITSEILARLKNDVPTNGVIVDYAAGTGAWTKPLLNQLTIIKQDKNISDNTNNDDNNKNNPKGNTIVASDMSESACQLLAEIFKDEIRDNRLIIVNNKANSFTNPIENKNNNNDHDNNNNGININNNNMDIILMAFTLHHIFGIENRSGLMKQFKDNLKEKTGKFILIEFTVERALMKMFSGMSKKWQNNFQSIKQTNDELKKYGFKSIDSFDLGDIAKKNNKWKTKLNKYNVTLDGFYVIIYEPI